MPSICLAFILFTMGPVVGVCWGAGSSGASGVEGMERKFNALVEPVLGDGTETLFKLIRNTGDGNTLPQIAEILSGDRSLH